MKLRKKVIALKIVLLSTKNAHIQHRQRTIYKKMSLKKVFLFPVKNKWEEKNNGEEEDVTFLHTSRNLATVVSTTMRGR
jgi:hypothetical protein